MKRNFIFILLFPVFALGIFIFTFSFANKAFAQEPSNIAYPVKELGNCKNQKECSQFCDNSQNAEVCTDFALNQGMISQEEAEMAKKMLSSSESGPGGCKNPKQCKSYCDDISHIDECLAFAEKQGLMKPDDLKEAKAAAEAIKKGAKPPGNCKSKSECDSYCDETSHTEECVSFGEAAGFISPQEAAMIRKTRGVGPGGCRGKEKCDSYCNDSSHQEECLNFALDNNLIPPGEAKEAKMALEAIKKGIKPPDCRGKDECDKYCSEPDHAEECVAFAEAAGFMSPQEAEQAKKMMKAGLLNGPGGCKGKEECQTYCDDLSHMEECIDFGEKAGFMSPQEAEQAKKMMKAGLLSGPGGCKGKEECQTYCDDPNHSEECVDFAVKAGFMSPEDAQKAKAFTKGGPGGCRGEECKTYCDDQSHQEECLNFAKENNLIPAEQLQEMQKGMQMMEQGGPGGCKGREECQSYCDDPSHQEECLNWARQNGMMPPQGEEGNMMPGGMQRPDGEMRGGPRPEENFRQGEPGNEEEFMGPEGQDNFRPGENFRSPEEGGEKFMRPPRNQEDIQRMMPQGIPQEMERPEGAMPLEQSPGPAMPPAFTPRTAPQREPGVEMIPQTPLVPRAEPAPQAAPQPQQNIQTAPPPSSAAPAQSLLGSAFGAFERLIIGNR